MCPKCDSQGRKYAVILEEKLRPLSRLGIKHKDSTGFLKKIVKLAWKRARGTGRKAKEELIIDRTNAGYTTKTHQVWEMNEQAQLEKVHDHKQTFRAKHRPRK